MTEPAADPQFEVLLGYLKDSRGFDFTGYKRTSLMRRVTRRMEDVAVPSFDEYLDFLQVHPEEFTQLFNTILINVTSFFRDPAAWDQLTTQIVPEFAPAQGYGDHPRLERWLRRRAGGVRADNGAHGGDGH